MFNKTQYRLVPAFLIDKFNIERKLWWWPFWVEITCVGFSKKYCLAKIKHYQLKPEMVYDT